MKWFLDSEFYERPGSIDLISVGLVSSDGRELYMENAAFDWDMVPADHWLHENVRPHLRGGGFELHVEDIRDNILRAVGKSPEFYGWYCDYDWVVFCWIFGRMIDLPDHFPKFCHDLRQMAAELHVDPSSLPQQEGTEHDALEDARWNKLVYEHLRQAARRESAGCSIHPEEARIVASFLQMPPEMDDEAVQVVMDVYRRLTACAAPTGGRS